MNVFKRIGLLGAVITLAALTSFAKADNWSYSWNGQYDGAISAQSNDPGNGGRFRATLTDTTTAKVIAYGSYCNELGQNIEQGTYIPTDVVALTSKNQLQWENAVSAATTGTLGTYGGPSDTHVDTYSNITGFHSVADAQRNELAWVVAQHFFDAQGSTVEGNALDESALQLAIWHLWGFDNIAAYGGIDTSTAGGLAQSWVNDAAAHADYINNNVLWVRLRKDDQNNIASYQDQIMFVTPEASSLAMLLPGLIPVGFALRRRFRRA